jgi:hypothetical protein
MSPLAMLASPGSPVTEGARCYSRAEVDAMLTKATFKRFLKQARCRVRVQPLLQRSIHLLA